MSHRTAILLLGTLCLSVSCSNRVLYKKTSPEYLESLNVGKYYLGCSLEQLELSTDPANIYPYSIGSGIQNDTKLGSYGIDVSYHQGNIDWLTVLTDSVPERISYAIIKSTEGVTYQDPKFITNFAAAANHHIKRGAYHFYVQLRDPILQAKNFLANSKLLAGDLFPILDVEANCPGGDPNCPELKITKEKLITDVGLFIKTVEDSLKCKVIIYTGDAFYASYLKGKFPNNPFWIARYNKQGIRCFNLDENHTASANSCPGNSLRMGWQYTSLGKINGIKGNTDFNIFCDYCLNAYTIR